MNIAELSPEERLIAEQAVLNLRTLNSAADAAVDGTVFAIAEKLARMSHGVRIRVEESGGMPVGVI